MKGTIEKIWENKSRSGQKYLALSIDGQKYSLWEEKYFDQIHEGEMVDFDWKKSGKFRNIIRIAPIDEDNFYSDRRQRSIIRMSCLRSASELISDSEIELDKKTDLTIEVAKKFEEYITEDYTEEKDSKPKKKS